MTPHMYVRNHMAVPAFAWYFLMRIGWGTGNKPTRVPCCRNLRISDSSVRPLKNGHTVRFHCRKSKTCSKQCTDSFLTCQCRFFPPVALGPAASAWWSEVEVCSSRTAPVKQQPWVNLDPCFYTVCNITLLKNPDFTKYICKYQQCNDT